MKTIGLPSPPITARRVGLNTAALWLQVAVTTVVMLFFTPFLLRSLGKDGYGLWSLAWVTATVLVSLDLGMQAANHRFMSQYIVGASRVNLYRAVNSSIAIMAVISLFLTAIMLAASFVFAHVQDVSPQRTEEFRQTFWILSATIPLLLLARPFQGLLVGLQAGYKAALASIVGYLVFVATAVAGLKAGIGDFRLLAGAMVANYAIRFALVLWAAWRGMVHISLSPRYVSREHIRLMLSFGRFAFLLPFSVMMMYQLDTLLVGIWLGESSVAYYRIPMLMILQVRTVSNAIGIPLLPVAAQLRAAGKIELLRELYHVAARMTGAVGGAVLLPLVIFGESFMGVWLGDELAWTWKILAVLSLGQLFSLLAMPGEQMLMGAGRMGAVGLSAIGGVCLKLIGALAALSLATWALMGLAWATSIPLLLSAGIVVPVCICRQNDMAFAKYLTSTLGRILLAAIPATAVMLFVRWAWSPRTLPTAIGQVAAGVAVCAVCGWFLALTDRDRTYLVNLIKGKPTVVPA